MSGFSTGAHVLAMRAVSDSTLVARAAAVRKFAAHLQAEGKESFSARDLASWLAELFDKGLVVGSILSFKTAVSMAVQAATGQPLEDHWLTRVVQGMQRERRPEPRYDDMWDAKIAYRFYRELGPIQGDKIIVAHRRKAVFLVRLAFAARAADVLCISRASVQWSDSSVSFRLFRWKTQGAGGPRLSDTITLEALPAELRDACAVAALHQYMAANSANYVSAGHDYVWTAYNSSTPVKTSTILADCQKEMTKMNIPIQYKPASLRHAAISAWAAAGVTRDQAMRRSGHKAANTITKFYDRSGRGDDWSSRVALEALSSGEVGIPTEEDTCSTNILSERSDAIS